MFNFIYRGDITISICFGISLFVSEFIWGPVSGGGRVPLLSKIIFKSKY